MIKSIKQQYIDLREGRMTQQNFMRNLRMTMPQYITNITSFNDSVRILKNKGILVESDIREKNLDVDQEELKKGIAVEKEHTNDPVKAEEIALDHLAEDPEYYTKLDKAGLEESHDANEQWLDTFKSYIGDIDIKLSPTELLDKYDGMSPKDAAGKYFKEFHSAPHSGEPGLTGHMEKIAKSLQRGLKEAKDEKGKWTNADGKSMYGQFKEIDNLNGQEVLIGIDCEMQKNHELTKLAAAKIVLKNLKKNPIYYTMEYLAGKEGAEPEYMGGKSANAEARHMHPVDGEASLVDKKMGMQPVKGVEKAKKDADAKKETNKIEKGVDLMTLVAQAERGVQKMAATGEKMKKISMKESIDKQYGVYELSFGQPYNFYNEEQNKFIWGDPSKATLYTKEEAEIVRKKLLKPRIDNYQRTGENYQEIHIGDLYKKRILKEQLRLQKLAGIKINEMHGEEDFKDSVISYLVDKYSDLISSKNWEELKQKIEQDFPSLSAELIIQYFEDNDVDDDIDYENMDLDGYQDVGGDSKYDEYVNEIGMNSNIHELVDKALAKERLKEMIRQELKEITGAYGGDDVDGEDGSSYLEEEAKINTTDVFDIHPLTGAPIKGVKFTDATHYYLVNDPKKTEKVKPENARVEISK